MKKLIQTILIFAISLTMLSGCFTKEDKMMTTEQAASMIRGMDWNIEIDNLKGDYQILSQKVVDGVNEIELQYDGYNDLFTYTATYVIKASADKNGDFSLESFAMKTTQHKINELTLNQILKLLNVSLGDITGEYTLLESTIENLSQKVKIGFVSDEKDYECSFTSKIEVQNNELVTTGVKDFTVIKDTRKTVSAHPLSVEEVAELLKGKDTNVAEKDEVQYTIVSQTVEKQSNILEVTVEAKKDKTIYNGQYYISATTNNDETISLSDYRLIKSSETMKEITCEIVNSLYPHKEKVDGGLYTMLSQSIKNLTDEFVMQYESLDGNYNVQYKSTVTLKNGEYELGDVDITVVKDELPDNIEDAMAYYDAVESYYKSKGNLNVNVIEITNVDNVLHTTVNIFEPYLYITDVITYEGKFSVKDSQLVYIEDHMSNSETYSNFNNIFVNYDSQLVSEGYYSSLQLTNDWQYILVENNSAGFTYLTGSYKIDNNILTLKNPDHGLYMEDEPDEFVFEIISVYEIASKGRMLTTQEGNHFYFIEDGYGE